MKTAQPIEWSAEGVVMMDQRLLPHEVVYHTYTDYADVARGIKDMEIRGAPAIGVAAAMGIALGVERSSAITLPALRAEFETICDTMSRTRPTAVDLFWAIARFRKRFDELAHATNESDESLEAIRRGIVAEAKLVHAERRAADDAIGRFGAEFMPKAGRVMTQCNAGALATAGIGTALGVIRVAVEERQHARSACSRDAALSSRRAAHRLGIAAIGIPLMLITDNMVGHFLKTGGVGAIVVGADRIAANGDTANKIGTYPMAVLARENGVPFYVAAPISTLDLSLDSGEKIPIEQRSADEVTHLGGRRIAADVPAAHPAFDVTPAKLIAAIITERGVARAPYNESLRRLVAGVK